MYMLLLVFNFVCFQQSLVFSFIGFLSSLVLCSACLLLLFEFEFFEFDVFVGVQFICLMLAMVFGFVCFLLSLVSGFIYFRAFQPAAREAILCGSPSQMLS